MLLLHVATYLLGYFVVGLTFAIGSNVLKVTGLVPDEMFDIDLHPTFFYGVLSASFLLWYICSLVYAIRLILKDDGEKEEKGLC